MSAVSSTPKTHSSPYLPVLCPVKRVDTLTDLEKRFVLELPDHRLLGHEPGQFVQVSLFGFGEAPISVCSAPLGRPEFELTVRRVGVVTQAMHELVEGDVLGIRGPYGSGFRTEEFVGKDILFIAGGIGLAPLRSFIDYVADPEMRDRFGKIVVIYGAKTPQELLFLPDLARWREKGGLDIQVTVDRDNADWEGQVGVVTTLIPDLDLDPRRTMVAIVGPPVMYRFVLLEIFGRGVPFSNIRLSLERRMKCGLGVCGHCQINGIYACKAGPVFSYTDLRSMDEAL